MIDLPLPAILDNHREAVLWGGGILFLILHALSRRKDVSLIFSGIIAFVVVLMFGVLWARPEPIPFGQIAGFLFVYGVTLLIVLSDILAKRGLAAYLTRRRGENWPKEIDYIYLGMGAVGVLVSLNRIEIVTDRFQGADIIAPLLLATAVVLRVIKTRAEIGGWNKVRSTDDDT